MADARTAVMEALRSVYDPCCQEKGLSVVEMGLVRSVAVDGDQARPAPTSRSSGTSRGPSTVCRRRPGASSASCPTPRRLAVIGDAFVFDGVAHVFNFEKKNALGPPGEMFNNHLYAFHATLTPDGQTVLPPEEFLRQWTVDEIDDMVYRQSGTDMLVAMPLPLTDLFRDGLSPWEECAELARRNPERTVWGSGMATSMSVPL